MTKNHVHEAIHKDQAGNPTHKGLYMYWWKNILSIIKQIGLYKFIKKTPISREENSHYYSRCGFTLKSFSGQKRYYQQGSNWCGFVIDY